MKNFGILCLTFTFLSTNALACIDKPVNFDISIEAAGKGNYVIKRTIDGQPKEDLLDDTGYLGALVAAAQMMKGKEGAMIDKSEQADNAQFLIQRLKRFKEVAGPNRVDLGKKIDDLMTLVREEPTFSKREFETKWQAMQAEMSKSGIRIGAQSREPGTTTWGPDTKLSNFTLPSPSTAVSRDIGGCGSDVMKGFKVPKAHGYGANPSPVKKDHPYGALPSVSVPVSKPGQQ